MNEKLTSFKLDTGAVEKAIPAAMYSETGHGPLPRTKTALRGQSNNPLKVSAQFNSRVERKIRTEKQHNLFFVIQRLATPVLSLSAIVALEFPKSVKSIQELSSDIKKQYTKVFIRLGNTRVQNQVKGGSQVLCISITMTCTITPDRP